MPTTYSLSNRGHKGLNPLTESFTAARIEHELDPDLAMPEAAGLAMIHATSEPDEAPQLPLLPDDEMI